MKLHLPSRAQDKHCSFAGRRRLQHRCHCAVVVLHYFGDGGKTGTSRMSSRPQMKRPALGIIPVMVRIGELNDVRFQPADGRAIQLTLEVIRIFGEKGDAKIIETIRRKASTAVKREA